MDCISKCHSSTIPIDSDEALVEDHKQLYYDAQIDATLSTINWDPVHSGINQFLQAACEVGFTRFELNHQIPPEVFEQIDFDTFCFNSLHNPCPAIIPMKQLEIEDRLLTSLDEKSRQSGMDVLKNTIETARLLGARLVVIHSGWVTGSDAMDRTLRSLYLEGKENTPEYAQLKAKMIADRNERGKPHLQSLMKSFWEIIEFTGDCNLMLGIENLLHYYEMPNFNEMSQILGEFKQPWFGWQLDTGHIQVQQNLGLESFLYWLEQFAGRMVGIHLHDVMGLKDHLAPGLGKVDFAAIAPNIPPHAQRTLEVKPFVTPAEITGSLPLLEKSGCLAKIKKYWRR